MYVFVLQTYSAIVPRQVKLNQKARKVSTGFCVTLKPKNLLCGRESLFVILDTGEKGDDYERDAGNVHVCVW